MRNTEPWWVCAECGKPIIRTKRKGSNDALREHRKICYEFAGFSIKQVTQDKSLER